MTILRFLHSDITTAAGIRSLLSLKGIFKPARFLQENIVSGVWGAGAQGVGMNYMNYANKCSDTNSDEDSEGIG